MTRSVLKLLITSLIVVLLSSCGFSDWSKRMGEKFPVSGDSKRCDNWFCFEDDTKNKSKHRRKLNNPTERSMQVESMPVRGEKLFEADKSGQNPNFLKNSLEISEQNQNSKPPPMPPANAIPPGAPSKPPTQAELHNIGSFNPESDDMSFDPNFDPELYRPKNLEKRKNALKKAIEEEYKNSGLKQHEIEAKWKDDLPEGPLGDVRKNVGW